MKRNLFKKLISLAVAVVVCFSLYASFSRSAPAAQAAVSKNQQNIVDRADYVYSLT